MTSSGFDIAACAAALGADAYDFQLISLVECDSTNTQLIQLAVAGAPSGTALVAERQTAGRGRREHRWISSPQHSLTFSLLWRFSSESSAPEALSLAVGLGLQRALAATGVKALVKWPNDILCKGKKLAGVLIETQPGDIKSVVVGIGINLALPPALPTEIASGAIGLNEILPTTPTREHLLATLLPHVAAVLRDYEAISFAGLRDEWQARHAFHGCNVSVSGGGDDVNGVCAGVNECGELLITTERGTHRVISGDLSLRPA
jgi:BirA family transcriptional regulator, biotin operon repressor / biotin---[acetyl-CoA-carboxylase] ligase